MKVPVEIEIDETKLVQVCKREDIDRLMEAVSALYGKLWIEACYDPYNEQTHKLARECLGYCDTIKECLKIPRDITP